MINANVEKATKQALNDLNEARHALKNTDIRLSSHRSTPTMSSSADDRLDRIGKCII